METIYRLTACTKPGDPGCDIPVIGDPLFPVLAETGPGDVWVFVAIGVAALMLGAFLWALNAGGTRARHRADRHAGAYSDKTLQAMADWRRDNAAEQFADVLRYDRSTRRWVEIESGEPVVFTPYGYRKESEIRDYLS